MIKLSIVIVSFNVSELLDTCLESLQVSTKNISHEIFVVDNHSQDNSTSLVKKKFPSVHLIENKQNQGFSKANNQALKKTKGQYILILNPDTEILPDTLKAMLNFMDNADSKVGASSCRVELPNGQLDRDCRRSFPTPLRAIFHFSGLSKIFKGSKTFDSYYMGHVPENQQIEVDSCVGAFILIRSQVLDKVGLFDENFFFYGEDIDLCYRVHQAGYKIIYTPITKIIHHKGASSGIKRHSAEISKSTKSSRVMAIKESTRAMQLFYKKHYQSIYPKALTWLVLFAIGIIKYLRLLKINLS